MSSSSCYSIYTDPNGDFPLSIFTINYIPTSIYEPSTLTFTNEIDAFTAVDIIQSELTKI
jgi:hypothetical protein